MASDDFNKPIIRLKTPAEYAVDIEAKADQLLLNPEDLVEDATAAFLAWEIGGNKPTPRW